MSSEGKEAVKLEDVLVNSKNGTNFNENGEGIKRVHKSRKKKKKNYALIFVLLLICILGVASFKIYQYFAKNPTEIIKMVINDSYERFSKTLNDYTPSNSSIDLIGEAVSYSGSLNFKNSNYIGLENEKIIYGLTLDYPNEVFDSKIKMVNGEEMIADIRAIMKNDNLYLKSESMFDNVYNAGKYKFSDYFDFSELKDSLEHNDDITVEDIDYVVGELKDILIASLDPDKMTLSKENVEVLGKTKKTDKVSYILDTESMKNLNDSFIDGILGNDDLLDRLSSLTDMKKDELKSLLSKSKENYAGEFASSEFNIYTTGISHEVVKLELKDRQANLEILFSNDDVLLSFKTSGIELEIKCLDKGDDYEVTGSLNGQEIIKLTFAESDDELDLEYEISYMGLIDFSGNMVITREENTDSSVAGRFEFSISGNVYNEPVEFEVEGTYEIKSGVKLGDIDVSNAITSEAITDEDTIKMTDSMLKIQESKIYKYFEDLLGSSANNNPSF